MKKDLFKTQIIENKLLKNNPHILGISLTPKFPIVNSYNYIIKHSSLTGILYTTLDEKDEDTDIDILINNIHSIINSHVTHINSMDFSWGFLKHELTTQYFYKTNKHLTSEIDIYIKALCVKINIIKKGLIPEFILQIDNDLYKDDKFILDWNNGEEELKSYINNIPNEYHFTNIY